jgi:Replication-relaxation
VEGIVPLAEGSLTCVVIRARLVPTRGVSLEGVLMPATNRPRTDPLIHLRHLTARDRLLLAWLADHQTLTTGQIATALFPSVRAAQKRLTLLYRIGALDRFSFARTAADNGGLRYTLGPLGDLLHPRPGPRRSTLQRRIAVARSPMLDHLLGVNGFFTDLVGYARTHPAAGLLRWWSEPQATAVYALAGVRPDGHGIWRHHGHTVGFFLEHDRGTENHRTLLAKLPAYQRLVVTGPSYPVLFHLPSIDREVRLQHNLAHLALGFPVATAVHAHHPAEAVWALAGRRGPRLRLDEIPSDHGPHSVGNPHRYTDPHAT